MGAALDSFAQTRELVEQTRAQLEIARLSRAAGEPRPLITRAYISALDLAESCRRAHLVREIDEELKAVNAEAHYTRIFRRVRAPHPKKPDSSFRSRVSTFPRNARI